MGHPHPFINSRLTWRRALVFALLVLRPFRYNWNTGRREKLDQFMAFPMTMDMGGFVDAEGYAGGSTEYVESN